MYSSNSPVNLRIAVRYYRRELRRQPDPPRRDWLEPIERELSAKLVVLTGSADCRTPEAWR